MNITDASLLQQAARAAAGAQQYPAGALYMVATPIGNLADLSLRAIHVLALVDAVACEDTRVSGGLLHHLGLSGKPLLALHEHNEAEAAERVVARLAQGQRVAYVSDAGTPAVSDPGARLVEHVRSGGHRVVPVPGASTAAAAMSVAGDSHTQGFRFVGFLPASGAARAAAVASLAQAEMACVLFEAPHRVRRLAVDLAQALPGRAVTVCRELTKQFESIATMPAHQLPGWLADDDDRCRGEFALVVHAPAGEVPDAPAEDLAVDALLRALMQAVPLSQAATLAARACGRPRKALYARALALRDAAPGAAD